MQNVRTSIEKWARCAATATVLMCGPMAISSRGDGVTVIFDDGRAILDACGPASGDLGDAIAALKASNASYQQSLDAARPKVLDAIVASKDAAWPVELRRRRRIVDRILESAAAQLARTTDQRVAARLKLVRKYAVAANRYLDRARRLLDPIVPPAPLDNLPPVVVGAIAPPAQAGAFSWTPLSPSSDTRITYVSYSEGNDSWDGRSPTHTSGTSGPLKTPTAALATDSRRRRGYPDWVLFKRGDVYPASACAWMPTTEGRSKTEPWVMSSYGSGARPKFMDPTFFGSVNRNTPNNGFVAIVGLDFEGTHTSGLGDGFGFEEINGGTYLLIEDCRFAGFTDGINILGFYRPQYDVQIRGCILENNYSTDPYSVHSQGFHAGAVSGLLVEGCVFIHNGWKEGVTGAYATIQNHNVYIASTCSGVVVRGNISAQASATGLMWRPGGVCEDNLLLANPVGIVVGDQEQVYPGVKASGIVRRNVILDSSNIVDVDHNVVSPRGYGIWMTKFQGLEVYDNIVAHSTVGGQPVAFQLQYEFKDLNLHDNIAYKWSHAAAVVSRAIDFDSEVPDGTNVIASNDFQNTMGQMVLMAAVPSSRYAFSGNRYYSGSAASTWFNVGGNNLSTASWRATSGESNATYAGVSYPYPERDIASYMASIGGTPTLAAFLAEARLQSKSNWRQEYSAVAANAYIRQGFGRP